MESNVSEQLNESLECEIFRKYFCYRHSSYNKTTSSLENWKKFQEKMTTYEKIIKQYFPVATIPTQNKNESEKMTRVDQKISNGNNQHIFTKDVDNIISKKSSKPEEKKIRDDAIKRKSLNTLNLNRLSLITQNKDIITPIKKNSHISSTNTNTTNLLSKSKLFICTGGYPDIIQALVSRGWILLTDVKSMKFDYMWTLKTSDIKFSDLKKEQMVNHFWKNGEITRKSGLAKNIRMLYYKNIEINNFFPRCYELSEKNDLEDFIEDFKTSKAIALLKQFVSGKRDHTNLSEEMVKIAIDIIERKIPLLLGTVQIPSFSMEQETKHATSGTNSILIKKIEVFHTNKSEIKLISDREWYTIGEEDSKVYTTQIEKFEKQKNIGYIKTSTRSNSLMPKRETAQRRNEEKSVKSYPQKIIQADPDSLTKFIPVASSLLQRLEQSLPQFEMNGENNIWIMKPSGLSRGRGISCVNKLNDVLVSIKGSNQYIIQKYIENPMIILGRKFDIRQWILVTDLNPLTIWMFETPYLRFGAEEYKIAEFTNIYSHLTNNSIAKYSKMFHNDLIEGNMWENHQFSEYLANIYGRDVWKLELQEKIKKIVITSLDSARHKICSRKNSHELFGYDIMIDDKLNAWLIEVNASPAVDYSTQVTEKLVKVMSEDLIKVVVDYYQAPANLRDSISTGLWKKVFQGGLVSSALLPNV